MMGQEKLSEVREKLWRALAATGEDPIAWVEKRMVKDPDSPGLKALHGFMTRKPAKKRPPRPAAVTKSAENGRLKKRSAAKPKDTVLKELDDLAKALKRENRRPRTRRVVAKK
jgi:hypothetical protein